jgi:uncharacterized protein (TIGR04255 family)
MAAEPKVSNRVFKYKRPPIQEVICEISFKLPQPLDVNALEKMQPVWAAQYPQQNVVAERRVNLHLAVDKMESSETILGHKLIARSSDGKHLTQLGPTFLAVNRLSPYVGWEEEFHDRIVDRFREVMSIFCIETVTRVGLRYINRIDFPQRPLHWAEWFAVSLPVPEVLRHGGEFQFVYTQQLQDNLACRINFGTLPPISENATSVLLDIDVVWQSEIAAASLEQALDGVHRPHRELFEGYLLDKTRGLFHDVY